MPTSNATPVAPAARRAPSASEAPLVRFSDSPLWHHQRAYFAAQGPAAWSRGPVPHYVTTTPALAQAYAEVLAGFADDVAYARGGGPPRPLYVIELGAGTGRLGFRIARALAAMGDARRRGWEPIYVLTDLAEATVAWWQQHPWLAPLFATGQLDVARFDLTADRALHLRHRGQTIAVDAPVDAMAVIANYVLDGVPTDAFAAADGALYEGQVATTVATRADGALTTCELTFRPRRCDAEGYYGAPALDAALASYRDARGWFTFPGPALAGLERLRALCRGPWLLLAADKGDARRADVVQPTPPEVALHGSASLTVNFDAVGAWAMAHGGRWWHPEHRGRALEICAFQLATPAPLATARAFDLAIARRSPDDLHALKRPLVSQAGDLSLPEFLAYLRLSGHDAKVFCDCAPALGPALRAASPDERDEVALAIARVWDGYLPIGEPVDVARTLAAAAAAIDRPALAARLERASRALYGAPMTPAASPVPAAAPASDADDPFALFATG
jgi:hypothetical protein